MQFKLILVKEKHLAQTFRRLWSLGNGNIETAIMLQELDNSSVDEALSMNIFT